MPGTLPLVRLQSLRKHLPGASRPVLDSFAATPDAVPGWMGGLGLQVAAPAG